jgi:hypothetical protein
MPSKDNHSDCLKRAEYARARAARARKSVDRDQWLEIAREWSAAAAESTWTPLLRDPEESGLRSDASREVVGND